MKKTLPVALVAAAGALAALPGLADHVSNGAIEPTADEQLGIYELNRARNNPPAYGDEIGFDLSSVPARPPLALNKNLTGSAHFHAQVMFEHHEYGHTSALYGIGANQMAVNNGYDLFGNGLGNPWGTTNSIESIMRSVNQVATTPAAVKTFVIDKDVPGAGHRVHLLAIGAYGDHTEVGFGWAAGTDTFPEFGLPKLLPTKLCAIHTGHRGTGQIFLTGVVFKDANRNNRYEWGEGLGGVTVSVQGGGSTTSMAEGGWAIPVTAGARIVTCSGGPFVGTAQALALVTASNVEVDFHSGVAAGEVEFAFRGGRLPGPDVSITADPKSGNVPLAVDFGAAGVDGGFYTWDLGNGDTDTGSTTSNNYTDAGFYPVTVNGLDITGVGTAMVLVTAADPSLLPEGMTSPGDGGLVLAKALLKRKITVAGKDLVKLKANLEVPGGFLPEGVEVQVFVAGVLRTFTLDAKGKGILEDGSKLVLKAKLAKEGTGAAAGTVAKVALTLKGDLGASLEAGGLRDRTETRTVPGVAAGVLFHGRPWVATGTLTTISVAGKSGKGTLLPSE